MSHPLSKSRTLHGKHKGKRFLVCGCAPSLADLDLTIPPEVITIGPNRILNHPFFVPNYVMLCDRRPYSIDKMMGVYHQFVGETTYLVSTTLYDPKVKCHGYPPEPVPDFPFFPWRVGTMGSPINLKSFEEPLCSFATIPGPMIQAAIIMGASEVGVVGVDLQVDEKKDAHFYEDHKDEKLTYKSEVKDGKIDISPPRCLEKFSELNHLAEKAGVKITNLSPVKDSPFATVFPAHDFDEWMANA